MHLRADLAVYNSHGRLTAIAEVKNKLGTSADWAAKTRRNMLARGGFGNVEFFLFVTPERIYLWKDAGTDPIPIPPTYVADAQPEFQPYFQGIGAEPGRISGPAFEMVVSAWLNKVIRSAEASGGDNRIPGWLAESGLPAAAKDGRIEYEAVV